jgi:hypothetical protein
MYSQKPSAEAPGLRLYSRYKQPMMKENQNHNCFDEEKLISDVQKFGWTVMLIAETEYMPSFAYTVGLWKNFNHPELISFGFSLNNLQLILNNAGDLIKDGKVFDLRKRFDDFFEKNDVEFIKVDERNKEDYFGKAINYYKSIDFPALQLVWSDRNNLLPWEEGFEEEFKFKQPLLDRNADFKFKEVWNLAVFTTRQFLELNKPILRVVHDFEGDWQFLTGDQLQEDSKLVALGRMVEKDPTLNQVFKLEYGESAEREFVGGPWTITKETEINEN